MSMEFVDASTVKDQHGLFVALIGGTNAGKTFSALRMARGIAGPKGKIAVLDTEAGRTLHLRHEFAFNVLTMGPPHRPARYLAAAQAAQDKGFDVLVIDSFSQVWRGIGGVLDWAEEEATQMVERKRAIAQERNYRFDENYERDKVKMASLIKPKYSHRLMVNGFLGLRIPIIFSIRGQMTVEPQEAKVDENGRKQKAGPPKEVFKAYCESEFPFELTVSFRLSSEQKGVIDLSDPKSWKMEKDHRAIFQHGDQINEKHGAKLIAWARGSEVVQQQRAQAAREPERHPDREPEFEPAQQQQQPQRRTLGQYLDEMLAACTTSDDVMRLEQEDPTIRKALTGPSAEKVRERLERRFYALVPPPPQDAPADPLDAPLAA